MRKLLVTMGEMFLVWVAINGTLLEGVEFYHVPFIVEYRTFIVSSIVLAVLYILILPGLASALYDHMRKGSPE